MWSYLACGNKQTISLAWLVDVTLRKGKRNKKGICLLRSSYVYTHIPAQQRGLTWTVRLATAAPHDLTAPSAPEPHWLYPLFLPLLVLLSLSPSLSLHIPWPACYRSTCSLEQGAGRRAIHSHLGFRHTRMHTHTLRASTSQGAAWSTLTLWFQCSTQSLWSGNEDDVSIAQSMGRIT